MNWQYCCQSVGEGNVHYDFILTVLGHAFVFNFATDDVTWVCPGDANQLSRSPALD
jgi:hypothetical protein